GRQLFAPFDLEIHYGDRIGIVGANGSGKTTLIKLIMQELQPDSGTLAVGVNVVMGYYSQEQETLRLDISPLEFIRDLKPMTEQQRVQLYLGNFSYFHEKQW